MTGKIDLSGQRAIIEENGELSVYALADVEQKADGSWGPVAGASPSGTLNLGTMDADEIYGTEPGVDLASPLHPVNSNASYFSTYFESLDGWDKITTGSGACFLSHFYVNMQTGTTTGSSVKLDKRPNNDVRSNFNLVDSDRAFRIQPMFRDGADSRIDYITNGDVKGGAKGYGFKLVGGTLYGVVHDGVSESTVTLSASPPLRPDLLCRYNTDGAVEFFLDGTKVSEISHSLGTFDGRFIGMSVENTSAVSRSLWFSEFRMGIEP